MSYIYLDASSFNNEVEFCRVTSEKALQQLENLFLKNRISYFIKEEDGSFFSRLFGRSGGRSRCIVRINSKDVEQATELAAQVEGIELLGAQPKRNDWCPKDKLKKEEEKARQNA